MKNQEQKKETDKKLEAQDAYSEIEKDPMEGNAHEQDLLEQASDSATAAYTLDNGIEGDEFRQSKPDASKSKEGSPHNAKQ